MVHKKELHFVLTDFQNYFTSQISVNFKCALFHKVAQRRVWVVMESLIII